MPSSRLTRPNGAALTGLLRKSRARPLIMGVVNATDDSFYPGSRTPALESALERALALVEEGADLVDVGGQSTRPGSLPVSEAEELGRVVPLVEALAARAGVPISIDTDKAAVARACREAGAGVLNDVSALRNDPGMAAEASRYDAVILMHRGGESPKTMQEAPRYADVVSEVARFFDERIAFFEKAGGERGKVLVDPGIGFGKTLEHNLALLKHLDRFPTVAPVVLGASRKSFLGEISPDAGPQDRLPGSIAAACWAARAGCAVVRAHDVDATRRALDAWAAMEGAK